MEATIIISTQYYENYGDSQRPHWKPKGGFQFKVVANDELIMYTHDLKAILTEMVAEQSNDHEMFEYIEHEVHFTDPYQLSTMQFEQRVREQFEQVCQQRQSA